MTLQVFLFVLRLMKEVASSGAGGGDLNFKLRNKKVCHHTIQLLIDPRQSVVRTEDSEW